MQYSKILCFLCYRLPATSLMGVVGAVLLGVVPILDIDLFEMLIDTISHLHIESHEIDEFILPITLLVIGGMFDQLLAFTRRHHQRRLLEERIRTLQSLMMSFPKISVRGSVWFAFN